MRRGVQPCAAGAEDADCEGRKKHDEDHHGVVLEGGAEENPDELIKDDERERQTQQKARAAALMEHEHKIGEGRRKIEDLQQDDAVLLKSQLHREREEQQRMDDGMPVVIGLEPARLAKLQRVVHSETEVALHMNKPEQERSERGEKHERGKDRRAQGAPRFAPAAGRRIEQPVEQTQSKRREQKRSGQRGYRYPQCMRQIVRQRLTGDDAPEIER